MAKHDPISLDETKRALRFIWKQNMKFPGVFLLVLILSITSIASDAIIPVILGKMVDAMAHLTRTMIGVKSITWWFLALVIFAGTNAIMKWASGRSIIALNTNVMQRLGKKAFSHATKLSMEWHSNTFTGSTVRKILRSMTAVDNFNLVVLSLLLAEVSALVVSTGILFYRWPILGAIAMVLVVGFLAMSVWMTKRFIVLTAREANSADNRINGLVTDVISCISVVKDFGSRRTECSNVNQEVDDYVNSCGISWKTGLSVGVIQTILSSIMQVILIAAALVMWWYMKLTTGDVVYIITLRTVLQGHMRNIGGQISTAQAYLSQVVEVSDMMDTKPSVQDIDIPDPVILKDGAEIDIRNLTFRYGNKTIFHKFSYTFHKGKRIGLVGPSGSGKSTLTKLIRRIYDPQGGGIFINDRAIGWFSQDELRRNIAIVPQDPALLHRTIRENIQYGRPEATEDEVITAAKQAFAHDFIMRLPDKYDTIVGERGMRLSGGERQRIAIARAFMMDAQIVIFDEATSALDSETEHQISVAMENLMKGRTAIVIAHRLSTVVNLDEIVVLDKGNVVQSGTHADLITQSGLYSELCKRQNLQ